MWEMAVLRTCAWEWETETVWLRGRFGFGESIMISGGGEDERNGVKQNV